MTSISLEFSQNENSLQMFQKVTLFCVCVIYKFITSYTVTFLMNYSFI